ncbi:uncharacterized protein LOC119901753 isoform X3 [Micropterus salmoides]|uniref:uncharacterized protein LOC119901753 isoform X3 n=1 Tax=Micropterus salmoides TaxID=27706 RepID=UPI0018EC1F29|nr:uncharacterized protein LOC119901753 isoform X3 [Micropterus salmoides]
MTADVPQNFVILSWTFNTKVLVTNSPDKEPTVFPVYTGRIETDVKKYSVKVKNLQEADSGDYSARVTGEEERIVAEYNVTVQGPVSPVELSVDSSVSSSSDSCNLTVTCRTQDSHISSTFTCDTQTCSQEGGERSEVTTSAASLHVYLLNDSIICNHSNQVSWTEDIKKTKHLCPQADQGKQDDNIIVPVLVAFIAVPMAIGAAVCYHQKSKKKRKYKRENIENTIYATPQVESTTHPLNQIPTDASGLSPTTTYSSVGLHTGPVGSPERGRTLPESMYAYVERARS